MARIAACLVLLAACGPREAENRFLRADDGGTDADVDAAAGGQADAGSDATPPSGRPCVDDAQCDDQIACSFDRCDPETQRCTHVGDDTRCDDGIYCNGRERCTPGRGCGPGPVVTCQDGNSCTVDICQEVTKACAHEPRDADRDGDPDDRCESNRDCNEQDPLVSSTATEVCGNGKDDDCDDAIDEAGCLSPRYDSCAGPLIIAGSGTFALSTVGAQRDHPTSCGVGFAPRDVVARITLPSGAPADLELWAAATGAEVSLALFDDTCSPAGELKCAPSVGFAPTRLRARNLAPGTYSIVITTSGESAVELAVTVGPATAPPTNESCAAPEPLTIGAAKRVELVDAARDLVSACSATTGELTYRFTLSEARDVRVAASTLRGGGEAVLGLRNAACAGPNDELRCRTRSSVPLLGRALPAGDYVLTVAATAPIDANVLVTTAPPTPVPVDQSCAGAPAIQPGVATSIPLTDHEDAIRDGCFSGVPNAARTLTLTERSDVLAVGRFSLVQAGAVSLDRPGCLPEDVLRCSVGGSPVRMARRALEPGDYRLVVADGAAQEANLTVFVRAAIPPTVVQGADACGDAFEIPESGGFFVGDTKGALPTFDVGCDAPNLSALGANDHVLKLVLTQTRRVVFDMDGSGYTTILDVRQGATCPGTSIQDGCYVGFGPQRSFLERVLGAGTYWIVVDGYALQSGPYNLDVRVLPP